MLYSDLRNKLKWSFSQGTAADTNMVHVKMLHIQKTDLFPTLGTRGRAPGIWGGLSNLQHVGKEGSIPVGVSGTGKECGSREDRPKGHRSQQQEKGARKDSKHNLLRMGEVLIPGAKQKI